MNAAASIPVETWVEVAGSAPAMLAAEHCGSGIPFLWAHALLGCMAQDLDGGVLAWRQLADTARVIRYDARGHGRSDCAGDPADFCWQNLAGNMWQVAEHYTDQPLLLGGASMGCATALHAAMQRPEMVRGVVLVVPPTAWESRRRMRRNYRRAAALLEFSRALPLRLLKLVPAARDDASFQRQMLSVLARHLADVPAEGPVNAMRGAALSDLPPREQLRELELPCLILAWPDDATHPLSVAENLAALIPRARLEVIRDPQEPYQWPAQVRDFITALDT